MAIGVTFPENEDVVTFWWKIERLVRVESKVDIYKKELGNYAGYRLRKVYWKDLHYWGMKISRDAVTHVSDILMNSSKESHCLQPGLPRYGVELSCSYTSRDLLLCTLACKVPKKESLLSKRIYKYYFSISEDITQVFLTTFSWNF